MDYEDKEVFAAKPGRVEAALDFINTCKQITDPSKGCSSCQSDSVPAGPGRPLTPSEQNVYEASLLMLRLYFTGEINMSSPPMFRSLEEKDKVPSEKEITPQTEPKHESTPRS